MELLDVDTMESRTAQLFLTNDLETLKFNLETVNIILCYEPNYVEYRVAQKRLTDLIREKNIAAMAPIYN